MTACGEVYAPSLPGFGHTVRPDDFDTVYDLVHFCLDFIDGLPDQPITLVGLSFGGWLALELATKNLPQLDRLVLVDALGVKLSERETPDIADIFNLHPDEVHARSWFDQEAGYLDFDAMSDQISAFYEQVNGFGHLVTMGRAGFMTHTETNRSIELLAKEEAPRLAAFHAERLARS